MAKEKQWPRRKDVHEMAVQLHRELAKNENALGSYDFTWVCTIRDLMRHRGNTFEEAVLLIAQSEYEDDMPVSDEI